MDEHASSFRAFLAALQRSDGHGADATLARLLQLAPDAPQTRHARGLLRLVRDDAAAAWPDLSAAASAMPQDPIAQANAGLCLQRLQRHEEALPALSRALELAPTHADAWYNRALSWAAVGRPEAALDDCRTAVRLRPQHGQAWTLLAELAQGLQRRAEARDANQAALRLRPRHAGLLAQRALQRLEDDDVGGALSGADAALAVDADCFAARYARAAALHRSGRPDAAVTETDHALRLQPRAPDALKLRGLALQALHELDRAAEDVTAAARLRFAPGARMPPLPSELRTTSGAKLRHDVEQLRHLAQHGVPGAEALAARHAAVLATWPQPVTGLVAPLTPSQLALLGDGYNRLHHLAEAPRLAAGALSRALDGAAIERDYAARAPGITWVDGLLSDEALQSLRRYCEDSTFWFDFRHANGYLGAFFEDGFAAPLLLQIAEELRAAAPGIFRDYPLIQLWAFKYDANLDGIDLHADIAKVNVNFWITPDEANLEPDGGGLLIWDRKAPADWSLDEFNTADEAGQARIRAFLASHGAQCVRVPYRCNRAVVFDSDLFHRTDRVRFAPGYENRRINVTMLFGRRDGRLR